MPYNASDVLLGAKRKVRRAAHELLDRVEQKSRSSAPLSDLDKAWDEVTRLERADAPEPDIEAARKRFQQLRDGK